MIWESVKASCFWRRCCTRGWGKDGLGIQEVVNGNGVGMALYMTKIWAVSCIIAIWLMIDSSKIHTKSTLLKAGASTTFLLLGSDDAASISVHLEGLISKLYKTANLLLSILTTHSNISLPPLARPYTDIRPL